MTDLISGFDMVCEEDYNPKSDTFLEMLYTAKLKWGDRFKVVMHAGESYLRTNTELFDAILLGTRRIGSFGNYKIMYWRSNTVVKLLGWSETSEIQHSGKTPISPI